MKKEKIVIKGKMIEIKGSLARHKIVQKVVNSFIKTEYSKKGKGVIFKYPVENLQNGEIFIIRPGHKKNFDFKVEVTKNMKLGDGGHKEIAIDLRKKKQKNQKVFENLLEAITKIYICSENDVDMILTNCSDLDNKFKTGAKIEILLKVVKWLFIMEDIVYWDNEGRAFLFNFLLYVSKDTNNNRVREALEKVKNPDILKSFMKKCGIEWIPYRK